jgi:hypothetical protein
MQKSDIEKFYASEISTYLSLEDNYNGYGSKAISKQTISDAIDFLHALINTLEKEGMTLPMPIIALGDDDVAFEFTIDTWRIDIDIQDTNPTIQVIIFQSGAKNTEYSEKIEKFIIPINLVEKFKEILQKET